MQKLLYITVSTKPEEMSTSKTVGREFINRVMEQYSDYELMEIDVSSEYIPELNYKYFKSRAELVSGQEYEALSQDDKLAVDRINELCDQFLSADVYVIAAPMWSVMFPARLKMYIDCIILNDKVIKVTPDEVKGLLGDKEREMVYIQSSGGVYPKIFSGKVNHGVNYVHDIFKFLGISKFDKIMVEGVDIPSIGREAAIEKAVYDMDEVISNMQ
ncbi:FMN-dependent NADH-azoreductase [Clostridium sp. P21]|uniref:FMN dependent NADH:quinone oxidoreductase n=1 Tax=Clostridium muellerianum TaxID=2716538 RepID=A0A7Y0EF30_9CLOT|nr:NAD(P)H-dependent oxidoreductase [Clostridium muellerianum]NMM61315.1 FMN-dependent NADH-azoreductase [Clostridium muellerianum]